MHSDPDIIERIAKELHAHSWISFLKWDSLDLNKQTKDEFRAKARSGKMNKFATKDGFIPEGMELVPYVSHEVNLPTYRPRNEPRPTDDKPIIKNIKNIDIVNDRLTEDSQPKKRRGRPPGSKNKK